MGDGKRKPPLPVIILGGGICLIVGVMILAAIRLSTSLSVDSSDLDVASLNADATSQDTLMVTLADNIVSDSTAASTLTPTIMANQVQIELHTFTESGQEYLDRRLPADGRLTLRVVALVHSPPQIGVEGQSLYFGVEGGGELTPKEDIIHNGMAETVYKVGFTGSQSTVNLAAILDLPSVGRVTSSLSFDLINQELNIEMPPGYAVPVGKSPSSVPLPFQLAANPPDLPGQYAVRAQVNDGTLANANGQPAVVGLGGALMAPGGGVISYLPPADWQNSEPSQLCLLLPDRNSLPVRCATLVFGPPTSKVSLSVSSDLWAAQHFGLLRVQAITANNSPTYGVLSFQVAASRPGEATTLTDMSIPTHPVMRRPGDAIPLYIPGQANFPFNVSSGAWVARWTLALPGTDDQVVDGVIAPQALRLVKADIPIQLADGTKIDISTLDPEFILYPLVTYHAAQSNTHVLFRIFVPADLIDNAGRISPLTCRSRLDCDPIPAITSPHVIQTINNVNVHITPRANELIASGEDSTIINITSATLASLINSKKSDDPSLAQITRWRAVYLYGSVPSVTVQP